jgi:hypothetical protein
MKSDGFQAKNVIFDNLDWFLCYYSRKTLFFSKIFDLDVGKLISI